MHGQTLSEDKRKERNTEFAFYFVLHNFLSEKKRKVCCNKFSANEALITPEMRAETHAHVVINDKCAFFWQLN